MIKEAQFSFQTPSIKQTLNITESAKTIRKIGLFGQENGLLWGGYPTDFEWTI